MGRFVRSAAAMVPIPLIRAVIAVLALAGLAGCAPTPEPVPLTADERALAGLWVFESGVDVDGQPLEAEGLQLVFVDGEAVLKNECGATPLPLNPALTVTAASARTENLAACVFHPDYLSALEDTMSSAVNAERTGNTLEFSGGGARATFTLQLGPSGLDVQGKWALSGVAYSAGIASDDETTGDIQFGLDNRVSGSLGCVEFAASYGELNSGLNFFSNLVLTNRFACNERFPNKEQVSELIHAGLTIRINTNGDLVLGSIPAFGDYYFEQLG